MQLSPFTCYFVPHTLHNHIWKPIMTRESSLRQHCHPHLTANSSNNRNVSLISYDARRTLHSLVKTAAHSSDSNFGKVNIDTLKHTLSAGSLFIPYTVFVSKASESVLYFTLYCIHWRYTALNGQLGTTRKVVLTYFKTLSKHLFVGIRKNHDTMQQG
jgi:hypothetical protein